MSLLCALLLAAAPIEIVPAPQDLRLEGKHVFRVLSSTPVVVADDATEAERAALEGLFDALGFSLPVREAASFPGTSAAIYVGEPGRHAGLGRRKVKSFLPKKHAPPPGGYRLTIGRKVVVLAGADPAGTFHGLASLIQIARTGIEWPCLTIADHPDLALRGVYIEGPAGPERLRNVAAVKANLIVFSSDEFCVLTDEAAARWRRVFDQARALHLEPVPLLRTLADAAPLVRSDPRMAEGRAVEDRMVLSGDRWNPLTKRNVIDTETCPIEVRVSGHRCVRGTDYDLDPGVTSFPFSTDQVSWLVRRLPGGAIPDGATATVTYTYVPPDTSACCPNAPETRAALRAGLDILMRTLRPRFIHIDHGRIERLNACGRCRTQGQTNAQVFAKSVALIDELAKACDPEVRLMLWADAINPHQDARRFGLEGVAHGLPDDVVLVLRDLGGRGEGRDGSLAWAAQSGRTFLCATAGGAANAYAWCEAGRDAGAAGTLYLDDGRFPEALGVALDKAWSVAQPTSVWAGALNDYFDAALWRPGYEEVLDVTVAHVNRATLAGVAPEAHLEPFKERLKGLRKGTDVPADLHALGLAEAVYEHLATYLELEAAFAADRSPSVLRGLVDLVEAQGALDPALDEARLNRIIETVSAKGVFVPSTILFGRHVLPYRPMSTPANTRVFETSAVPAYTDREHHAEATYDFLASPGAVCRVDFETVGAVSLEVACSADGRHFSPVERWTSDLRGGVIGPAILDRPFQARYARISVRAPAERAVLRNTRVFALKPPARVACPYVRVIPARDDGFEQIVWPGSGRAEGFVRTDGPRFARAQTTVQVCRTRDRLLVGVLAHEPRMSTLVSGGGHRDASLWRGESIELWIHTGAGGVFRFVVSPDGHRFDSHDWDDGWDGDWRAMARRRQADWVALIALPFETLDVPSPKPRDTWRVNLIRNRVNVHPERSAWGPTALPPRIDDFGLLTFR